MVIMVYFLEAYILCYPKIFLHKLEGKLRFVYTDSTLSIEKPYATVAWSWYWVILHGVIRLWRCNIK